MAQAQKQFYYKVYDTSLRYISTWSTDVITDPEFRTVINGGSGELIVQLARSYDNFGENVDVALNNRVELWVADNDNLANNVMANTLWDTAKWDIDVWDNAIQSFIKLYTGYISQYAPVLDDKEEYVEITLLGYVTEASSRIIKDSSGNTTITYTSQDPSTILRDLIDKYRADGGTNLNYLGASIQTTGTTATYTFKNTTLKDALDKVVEFAPDNWYWNVDANGIIYFGQASTIADHSLTIGKDVFYIQTTKRIENIVNEVSVIGGGNPNLFNLYQRAASITTYGKRHRKIEDGQVTDNATSDLMAKRLLDMFQSPETRSIFRVIDNNGENTNIGTNIENFSVGDTVQLKNVNYGASGTTLWDHATWDVDVWDYTINFTTASVLTIVSIQYYPDYIEIEASSRLPEITKRAEDINKKIVTQLQQNLPTNPTVRTV